MQRKKNHKFSLEESLPNNSTIIFTDLNKVLINLNRRKDDMSKASDSIMTSLKAHGNLEIST